MRKETFTTGEIYHVFNRGVEKRSLFLDQNDYERFLESMYLFNDISYKHSTDQTERIVKLASADVEVSFREGLVEILAYCLMPNHYHFLVRQSVEGGISSFMHKLTMGYSRVFNQKYNRTGTLYEGAFKAKHVDTVSFFEYLPVYIHLNVLDLFDRGWREGQVEDWFEATQNLLQYPWSSHSAYLGRKQYLPIIKNSTIRGFYSNEEDYLNHLRSWSQRESLFFIPRRDSVTSDVTG